MFKFNLTDVEKQDDNLENVEAQPEVREETQDTSNEPDWKSEALKYKAIAERLKGKLTSSPSRKVEYNPEIEEIAKSVSELKALEDKRQFGFQNNLAPEEVDYLYMFSNGKLNKDILNNPFVKAGLDGLRQAKRLESNIPSSSRSSFAGSNKSFNEMSDDERRKAFEERSKTFQR